MTEMVKDIMNAINDISKNNAPAKLSGAVAICQAISSAGKCKTSCASTIKDIKNDINNDDESGAC